MTGRFANIIVDISHEKVDRPFQYRIPHGLAGKLDVGMAVTIPFGQGNRLIKGYVMEITDKAGYDESRLKEISSIIKDSVSAQGDSIKLAWWIKQNYGSTMISALKTVLPVKQKQKQLVKKTIVCTSDKETAAAKAEEFEKKHQTAKARLMRGLSMQPVMPYTLATGRLGIGTQTIQSLKKAGMIEIRAEGEYRSVLPGNISQGWQKSGRKQLSENQNKIVDGIMSDYSKGIRRTYLIHGVTGSGKTEVYMELIDRVITESGKQAIMLIPEIALTYQTLVRFYQRFGDRVSVMNSRLSAGERSDQYERAAKGEIDIMIGPRSALFTPFERLGLVIIDEEHEGSYKSESMPKYHAREVAGELCRMKQSVLVLGSATPSMESYYRAKNGEIQLFELKERLAGGQLPRVHVEDLRQELKTGNRSIFSRRLHALIGDRLRKCEQTMLFINRRGYAGFVSCRACGHVMKCPHCDVSLSEHTDRSGKTSRLVCHYCGYGMPGVTNCPQCGSKYISGFRAGTQQIEELLNKEFPAARVLRMDADTTRNKDSYEKLLSQFANGEADILVGTQMIVKGHDFARVTLVGILAADMSLHAGDYRAGERTFQLLTQAAGRAGRSELAGEVVIQTYQPGHYTIVHAANQDYESFYEEEMSYRGLMMYPPAAHMMAVLVLSADTHTGEGHARELAEQAKLYVRGYPRTHSRYPAPVIIGPAEASIGKINDVYRYIFYIKHGEYEVLTAIKDVLEEFISVRQWGADSVQFDFDPVRNY